MGRTLLIRVDCNPEIASGHLMRCLSVAKEAALHKMRVIFLMSDDTFRNHVTESGFEFINLNTDWKNLRLEIPSLKSIIPQYSQPLLLVDTYSITSEYISELKGLLPIAYLGSKTDGLGSPDCIINYSSSIDEEFYRKAFPKSDLLLGVKFAPLREEFQTFTPSYDREFKELLITTGNTDKPHFTTRLLRNIIPLIESCHIVCNVVVGRMFDNLGELRDIASECGLIRLHENVSDMVEIMRGCQLAISANGTTVYELAACGIPTISFAISREQQTSGQSLGEKGILEYCGLYPGQEERCVQKILKCASSLITDNKKRIELAQRANGWIDGKGCRLIVNHLKNL